MRSGGKKGDEGLRIVAKTLIEEEGRIGVENFLNRARVNVMVGESVPEGIGGASESEIVAAGMGADVDDSGEEAVGIGDGCASPGWVDRDQGGR